MGSKVTILVFCIMLAAMALSFQSSVGKGTTNPYIMGSQDKSKSFQTVTVKEVKSRLAINPKAKLADVRTKEEYSMGHIEGAINISLEEINDRASAYLQRNEEIIIYSPDGVAGENAASILTSLGYSNVSNMTGGIEKWKAGGYPVVK